MFHLAPSSSSVQFIVTIIQTIRRIFFFFGIDKSDVYNAISEDEVLYHRAVGLFLFGTVARESCVALLKRPTSLLQRCDNSLRGGGFLLIGLAWIHNGLRYGPLYLSTPILYGATFSMFLLLLSQVFKVVGLRPDCILLGLLLAQEVISLTGGNFCLGAKTTERGPCNTRRTWTSITLKRGKI
jgi:hypothetical protein